MDSQALLTQFLSIPIHTGSGVFEIFRQLPNAVYQCGDKPLERFVYIPGTRKDRVVLVAHADTVWDEAYQMPNTNRVTFRDGCFHGTNPDCGIGADDRAGCAMVWALRNSGHSLLILDGEEKGKHGAKYLRSHFPKLYRELNRHRYMMEFDWSGTHQCLFNQVLNTQKFKKYIADSVDFHDSQKKGGCDLQVLCKRICGVNMGVGWHNWHTPKEYLCLHEWDASYAAVSRFLETPQRKFPTSYKLRLKAFPVRVKGFAGRILRKLGILKNKQ